MDAVQIVITADKEIYKASSPIVPSRNALAWAFARVYEPFPNSPSTRCRYVITVNGEKVRQGEFILSFSNGALQPRDIGGVRIRRPRTPLRLRWQVEASR